VENIAALCWRRPYLSAEKSEGERELADRQRKLLSRLLTNSECNRKNFTVLFLEKRCCAHEQCMQASQCLMSQAKSLYTHTHARTPTHTHTCASTHTRTHLVGFKQVEDHADENLLLNPQQLSDALSDPFLDDSPARLGAQVLDVHL